MAASLKVSELLSLTSVAASDLILIADVDATASKKTTFSQFQSSISLANIGSNSVDNLSDVDISTVAPTNGQTLVWNSGDGEFQPGSLPTAASLNLDDLITLTGMAEGATELGVFNGNTIADNLTVKAAIQSLEDAVELRSSITIVNEIDGNVDDLITLTGVAENSVNLGTFTGTTITDNVTVKTALQEIETALELTQDALSGGDGISLAGDVIAVDLTESYDAPVYTGGVGPTIPYGGTYQPLGNFVLVGSGPYTFTANGSYEAYYKKEFGQYDIVMIYNTTAGRWEGFQVDFTINPSVDTYSGGESVAASVDLTVATSETKNGYLSPDSSDDNISYTPGGAQSFLEFDNSKLKVRVLDEDTMSSNSDQHLATQQSIKAYVDNADNTLFTNQAEIDGNVDDLITLTGITENTTNLGSFTGSVITTSSTIKTALQELETEVETKQDSVIGGDGIVKTGSTLAVDLALTAASNNVAYLPDGQTDYDANPDAYSAHTFDWELHPNFGVVDVLSGSIYLNTGAVGGVSTESAVDAIWWRVDPTNSSAYQLIARARVGGTTYGWYGYTGLTVNPSNVTTNGGNFGAFDDGNDFLLTNFHTTKQVGGKYYIDNVAVFEDFIYEDSTLTTSKKLSFRDRTDSGNNDEFDSPKTYDFVPVDGLLGYLKFVSTTQLTLDTAASTAQIFSKDNGDGTWTLMGRYNSTSGSHYTFTGVTTNPATFAGTDEETLHTYTDQTERDNNYDIATTGTQTIDSLIYPSDSFDIFVDQTTQDGSFLEFQNNKLAVSVLDEDNLASDSAAHLATQQSIKAYVDAANTAQDSTIASTYINKDGSTAFTGAIDLGGFRVTNQAEPTLGSDSATKTYVDAATAGQGAFWTQVRLEASTNFDISAGGLPTIDGETVVAGDRVLLDNQTDATENGIYVAAAGAWSRAADADTSGEFLTNKTVFVAEGNVSSGRIYAYDGPDSPTLGTDNIGFTLKSSAAQLADGAVSTTKIADLAVTNAKINDVATSKLTGTLLDATVAESNVTQHQGALTLNATQITAGTLANARISAASVTQHQALLSITESQISDLTHVTKADLDVDHIETLTGAGIAADDLGTFTGTTITDASTIKTALQELETEVETKQDGLTTGNGLLLSGSAISVVLAAGITALVLTGYTTLLAPLNDSYGIAFQGTVSGTLTSRTMAADSAYNIYTTSDLRKMVAYNTTSSTWEVLYNSTTDFVFADTQVNTVDVIVVDTPTSSSVTQSGANSPDDTSWTEGSYVVGAGESWLEFGAGGGLRVATKDEDDMSSNSDVHVPTQQSVKAYVDNADTSLQTQITETDTNTDDLVTLTGVAENSTDLGTFTGDTIADSSTIKTALQALETALESDQPGLVEVHNNTGATIDKGRVVYINGTHTNGQPTIALADSDSAATMPAIGLMADSLSDGDSGFVVISGVLDGIDTDTFAWDPGTALYVSQTTGQLTSSRPSAAGVKVQKIGVVTRRHASLGSILVMGAGRTNDVPNELTALTGVALNATDLGTFTGTIVSDNVSIKTALQELETEVENLPLTNLDIDGGNSGTIGASTLFIADENGAGTNTKVTSGDIANYVAGSKTVKQLANVGTVADTEPSSYFFLVVDASTGDIKILDKSFVVLE
ncbi:putative tail fiber-like protein [Synechococcus phage S-N03]|uniref:Putative tail fiber-like protein n=1 Tax=Synechococcus phage S-N03 TaxID=2718943 RepID=A0A6G8R632_9CAUD|nr:tail fiber protein [Synechococcus phage S-N03]QIN96833.1 putative tail fiber-like protein [Synechococcus phage S-N03]